MPDKLRCRLHGGLAGRPPGTAMHPNTATALRAGRDRWLQRLRLAKERGLIEKFPNGRRRRGAAQLSADKTVARAQRLVEEMVMAKRSVPTPWDQMSQGEKLSRNSDLALDVTRKILELPVDPDNLKLLAQIKETALTVISQQIRVDEGRLRANHGGVTPEFDAALARQEKLLGAGGEEESP